MELQRETRIYQFGGNGSTVRVTATKSANGPAGYVVTVITGKGEPVQDATEVHLLAALQALRLARAYDEAGGEPVTDWPTGEIHEATASIIEIEEVQR